jgi:hypothetical protein
MTSLAIETSVESAITACIAPNCKREAALNSPLCSTHKEDLQRAEANILKFATRVIRSELRQFERLLHVEPPLHSAELSHRMVMPMKDVRKLLKKFRDDRA